MGNNNFFTPERLKELNNFLDTLKNVSDHSCAILAGSKIDSLLGSAIESRVLPPRPNKKSKKDDPLLENFGPLGSFSSKIEMAFRLGLITYQHANALDKLRKIRNDFAHETDRLTFDESPTKEHVLEFKKYWKGFGFESLSEKLIAEGNTKTRAEFITACSFFITLYSPLATVCERIERIKYVDDLQSKLEYKNK